MLYRDFQTQEQIDREYNPRLSVKDFDSILQRYADENNRVQDVLEHVDGIPYGPTRAEVVDIYPGRAKNTPVHIFIHGGYWHSFACRDFAFVSEALVGHGITVVHVNYTLCPDVSLDEIVRQCRSAAAWVFNHIEQYGGDPNRISVSGHSAGGHLAAMLLTTEWERDYALPDNLITAACPISGLFDLRPFPFSWLQPKLQLSWDQVMRNSPQEIPPSCCIPVLVVVGANESLEFRRQSEDYVQRLKQFDLNPVYHALAGRNHFTLLYDFLGNGGPLSHMILDMIN